MRKDLLKKAGSVFRFLEKKLLNHLRVVNDHYSGTPQPITLCGKTEVVQFFEIASGDYIIRVTITTQRAQ